jgi:hypothetical protein
MPLFGPLNYGALFPRRAFGLDQFLPADQEMARRGYPLYANDSGSGSGGGPSPAVGLRPAGGSENDMMRRRDLWGNPGGGGAGTPDEFLRLDQWGPLGQGLPPKAGAGAGPPRQEEGRAGGPFPTLGPQTTRRTQLFGPLANLSAPRLY